MTDGAALPEWLQFGHRKLPAENADELRNEKTESSGTTYQDVGRLAISFPATKRNASQVQLRSFLSSVTPTTGIKSAFQCEKRQLPSVWFFFTATGHLSFVQSGNKTVIADVRSSGPSTNGLSLRVIERSTEEMPVTLMDQHVYFHSETPGLLDNENEIFCHPAAPKRTSRRLSFRNFACAVAY